MQRHLGRMKSYGIVLFLNVSGSILCCFLRTLGNMGCFFSRPETVNFNHLTKKLNKLKPHDLACPVLNSDLADLALSQSYSIVLFDQPAKSGKKYILELIQKSSVTPHTSGGQDGVARHKIGWRCRPGRQGQSATAVSWQLSAGIGSMKEPDGAAPALQASSAPWL